MSSAATLSQDDIVLQIRELKVSFPIKGSGIRRERVTAVDHVSLTLHKGETLGLVGESGSGKSTLVKSIFGINKPDSGEIELFGSSLSSMSPADAAALRRRVQLVFQDPYSALDPRMTAHDIVAEPLRIAKQYSPERVSSLLEQVGFDSQLSRGRPKQLSGGQRQRLGIARALALEPEIVVLDEPVSALDVSVQAQVLNLLQDLQEELGLSYLFIAHDLSVVRHLANRVAVMRAGQTVEVGDTRQVFRSPRHPYTRDLLAAVPNPDPSKRSTGKTAGLMRA